MKSFNEWMVENKNSHLTFQSVAELTKYVSDSEPGSLNGSRVAGELLKKIRNNNNKMNYTSPEKRKTSSSGGQYEPDFTIDLEIDDDGNIKSSKIRMP